MVSVSVQVEAADACGAATAWRIVSVSSNEETDRGGQGNRREDWMIDSELSLRLRAA